MSNQIQKEQTLWETVKSDWYLFIIILVPLAIALFLYPQLPAKIPSHWGINGNIDGYSSKPFAVWFFPFLNLGIYFLLILVPRIDPRRENYSRFGGAYRIIRIFLTVFLSGLYFVTILVGLGYAIKVDLLIKLSVALMFLVLGNIMGKFQHNYFVGIKTPWTLASEEVWRKTHRLSGKLWVGTGAVCFILSLIGTLWANYAYFVVIMVMAFVPMLVSYIYYRQLQR